MKSKSEFDALQSCIFWHRSQCLPHPKVAKNILCATKKCVEGNGAMVMLNKFPHSGHGDSTPTKDLHGVTSSLLCG